MLCVVGDILLEFRSKQLFLGGIAAFASGHVAYIVAFVRRERALAPLVALPFAAWIGWALTLLVPGLGDMLVPVVGYTAVIGVMMWRSGALMMRRPLSIWSALALPGAILFAFSDTLIALDRYHAPIEGARIPIILTYYIAQLFIALSVFGVEDDAGASRGLTGDA